MKKNKLGKTALQIATLMDNQVIIKLLRSYGAKY